MRRYRHYRLINSRITHWFTRDDKADAFTFKPATLAEKIISLRKRIGSEIGSTAVLIYCHSRCLYKGANDSCTQWISISFIVI